MLQGDPVCLHMYVYAPCSCICVCFQMCNACCVGTCLLCVARLFGMYLCCIARAHFCKSVIESGHVWWCATAAIIYFLPCSEATVKGGNLVCDPVYNDSNGVYMVWW